MSNDGIKLEDEDLEIEFDSNEHRPERELTAEEKKILDRAVRAARFREACDEFEVIASYAFNLPPLLLLDSDGLSYDNRDREGYDKEGFNIFGYNKEGFNEAGYDTSGYNKDGFNVFGFNKDGFNAQGQDEYSFDIGGYNRAGFDRNGYAARQHLDWYKHQATKPESDFCFDRHGRPRPVKTTDEKKSLFRFPF